MSSSSTLFKKVDASNYITAKRQMAISNEYVNAINQSQFLPIKNNGFVYNKNFKFVPSTGTDVSNCLVYAKNFELLNDYSVGKKYINQKCNTI
jgi:hypothetical protein